MMWRVKRVAFAVCLMAVALGSPIALAPDGGLQRNNTSHATIGAIQFDDLILTGLYYLGVMGYGGEYRVQSISFDAIPTKSRYINVLDDVQVVVISVRNNDNIARKVISTNGRDFRGPNDDEVIDSSTFCFQQIRRSLAEAWIGVLNHHASGPFLSIQSFQPYYDRAPILRPSTGPWYLFIGVTNEKWYFNAENGRVINIPSSLSTEGNVTEVR